MARFLNGLNLEDLFFLGLQEQFRQDVLLLSQKLSWNLPKGALEIKKNPTLPKGIVDEEVRQRIAALNQADIKLYNQAIALKSSGHWD